MGEPVTSVFRVTAFSCLLIAGAAHADCLKGNSGIPPGANTTDPKAPFYIDTTDLDFKTLPPTRDPKNPNYPQATELPDGTLPPSGAEGNFIIGPTHKPAPELTAQDGVPAGKVYSFTMSSNDSTVYDPGMIRDDPEWLPQRLGLHRQDGARRQVEPDRSDRPRRHLDATRRRLCSAGLCGRNRDPVHRPRRRRTARLLQ